MDALHELNFQPSDARERQEFEDVVHEFLAREAGKPPAEASSVFVSYDAARQSWRVRFETKAALEAFRTRWRAQESARPSYADPAAAVPLGLLANPRFSA